MDDVARFLVFGVMIFVQGIAAMAAASSMKIALPYLAGLAVANFGLNVGEKTKVAAQFYFLQNSYSILEFFTQIVLYNVVFVFTTKFYK